MKDHVDKPDTGGAFTNRLRNSRCAISPLRVLLCIPRDAAAATCTCLHVHAMSCDAARRVHGKTRQFVTARWCRSARASRRSFRPSAFFPTTGFPARPISYIILLHSSSSYSSSSSFRARDASRMYGRTIVLSLLSAV